jgi:hypothetical protein
MNCPSFQTLNDDRARFCSSCGQRLAATVSDAFKTIANKPDTPSKSDNQPQGNSFPRSTGKLHSPLLSGNYSEEQIIEEDEFVSRKGNLERLSPNYKQVSKHTFASNKFLQSTNNSVVDADNTSTEPKDNKLHSPLLEGSNAWAKPGKSHKRTLFQNSSISDLSGKDADRQSSFQTPEPLNQTNTNSRSQLHSPLLESGAFGSSQVKQDDTVVTTSFHVEEYSAPLF